MGCQDRIYMSESLQQDVSHQTDEGPWTGQLHPLGFLPERGQSASGACCPCMAQWPDRKALS